MKNTLLFFLMLLGGSFIIWNFLLEDSTRIKSADRVIDQSPSSEDFIKTFRADNISYKALNDSVPKVELVLPEGKIFFSWGTQIRYTINVSDVVDGDSKYGEINDNAVILEIEYLPIADEEIIESTKKLSEKEHKGLSLMKGSTCFGCHADKTTLGGPSFSEMAERYEKTLENIKSLGGNISGGSSGVWGGSIMPAHPDFTKEESEQIADYILKQGRKKNSWILPGSEGTFRVIPKPHDSAKGIYILTASYISTLNAKGSDSAILEIK